MHRSVWLAFALVALGLWASLVPQITYASASSGEPEGDVLMAWPGWSIQQDLGPLHGSVGSFQIWVSADPTAYKDVTVNASLVDAATRDVLRQALVRVSRRYIPAVHTVTFPSFVPSDGQRLMLQFGVPEGQGRHVVYRLANPDPTHPNIMLNGVPDAGEGPLAFAHLRTGSGLRAALDGEVASRLRLVLGLVTGAIAGLAHPRIAKALGQLAGGVRRRAGPLRTWTERVVRPEVDQTTREPSSRLHRVLTLPVYPWPAAAAPILHYLASNPLHFAVSEAHIPLAIVLAAVTIIIVGLRVALKDWYRPAAICTALVAVFFGYGHAAGVVVGRLDDRLLFALAVVLAAIVGGLIVRRATLVSQAVPFLNVVAAILLVFPVASLAVDAVRAQSQGPWTDSGDVTDFAAHLLPAGVPEVSGPRPDIYYIILDTYARYDALLDLYNFDNGDFIRELEQRGFYVGSQATSNYDRSVQSIASSLNMAYLGDLGSRTPKSDRDLIEAAQSHALGQILQEIGYTYVHLDSGYIATATSPLADQVVTFTPSGPVIRSTSNIQPEKTEVPFPLRLSGAFVKEIVQTTALAPVLDQRVFTGALNSYDWHSSHRAIQTLEFLSKRAVADRPTFTFAHILKPHLPATFDQYGNQLPGDPGFEDSHDPTVPNAYIGQLIYVNKLVLSMIDAMLKARSEPPIIVISADHGYSDDRHFEYAVRARHSHSILSALHLPNGGSSGIYDSMSAVNIFRYILDYYFGLGLVLIDDNTIEVEKSQFYFGKA